MNYFLSFLISIVLLSYTAISASGQLIINEIVTCNNKSPVDGFGGTPDWIEIFNASEEVVQLNDYYLSDKKSEPQKWQFPKTQIEGKSYLVVYASGEDISNPLEIHTNFKIDSDGETILLSKQDSTLSKIKVPAIACNFSYGYLGDYQDSLVVFTNPTIGAANEAQVELQLYFSKESGFYKDSFALEISTLEDAEIRYTLNTALAPGKDSNLYTTPLNITNRVGDPNVFSEIPTSDTTNWKTPKEEVFKINIIRAAAFINGQQVSDVFTKSYAITPMGNERYTMPVISLVAEPGQFFSDSTGIYVLGDNYEQYQLPNFHYDWERDVFVEYFESDGQIVISQNAQIEIAGKTTRWRRQKSLKLKATGKRNKNRFEHNFFNTEIDEYRNLILKTPLADYRKSFIKDELLNELAENIELADADCEPVVVFLNGEYWGIHILQEKQDKYYLEDHYNVDKDSLNLLEGNATDEKEIIEGTGLDYLALRDYAVNNNLNEQQHFDYVAERINIENFINYYCFHMLAATRDWPWNNIKYWRPADESKKWEWIPHDFDSSYNFPETDGFKLASQPANEALEWSVLLYNNLMESEYFKSSLFTRLETLLNNEFCADSIVPLIDRYKNKYQPEIEEHAKRWNFEDSYNWEKELEIYYNFPTILAYVLQQIAKEDFEYEIATCDTFITSINQPFEVNNALFTIHPNPASNYLNIQLTRNSKVAQIYLTDIAGTVFLEIEAGNNLQHVLDINLLPAGVYFVYAVNNRKLASRKFIKLE